LQPSILQERYTIGSWGEQIPDSNVPEESAACFPPIVGLSVRNWAGADGDDSDDNYGDDGNSDDSDGDDGDGDAGNGNVGDGDDGDGVGDGDHSTSST